MFPFRSRAISRGSLLCAAVALALVAVAAPHASAQSGFPAPMTLYRANLHCHTGYSDGYSLFWPEGQTPATAYSYTAANGLNALAVTDHGEMLNTIEWAASVTAAVDACAAYWPFCAVHGFEWTGTDYVPDTGHVNVYGSRTRIGAYKTGQNTDDDVFGTLDALYGWLTNQASAVDSERSGSPRVVAQFNHPTTHDSSDHHNGYALPSDPQIREAMALFEMGSWGQDPNNPWGIVYEGTVSDNDTFDPTRSAEYWYRIALSAGWRLAPSNNGDNHLGDYVWHHRLGPPTCTGIYMVQPSSSSSPEARRSALLDALRARRTFAAEDRDAVVILSADAGASPGPWWMGTAFGPPPGSSVAIRIQASDPTDRIKSVELICPDGSKPAQWTGLNTFSLDETVELTDAQLAAMPTTNRGEICLYAKVTEKDGELLFAAPLWISRPALASSMATPDVFGSVGPVQFSAMLQRADTSEGLAGKPVLFSVNSEPIGTVLTDDQGLATMSWVVPTAVSYSVTAEFTGNGEAGASYATRDVDSATFTLLTAVDRTGTVTEATVLRAYLKRAGDNAPLAGRTITFRIDGAEVGSATTDANGRADLVWTIAPGPITRTIKAEFAGDVDLMSSIGTATLTAVVWTTKMASFNRTARITDRTELKSRLLRSDNAPLYNKAINFYVDGTFIITRPTNVDGYAGYPYYTVPDGAGEGTRTILAEWPGTAGYLPVSKTATLTALRAIPYIWVLPKTIPQGGIANLYAYFRRLYDYKKQEGKTVDFKLDGTVIQTVATDSVGVARHLYPTTEPAGVYRIRCEFYGDAWLDPGYGEANLTIY